MARKLPKKDVVIIGLGWTGSILANELTDEGLDVIAIERGPWRACKSPFRTARLSRGRHQVSVRAIDRAGNRDRTPARRRFRIR